PAERLAACDLFRWSGAFDSTSDGMPLIGPVPGMKGIFAAYGYGGNGITFSFLAARLIGALIAGSTSPPPEGFRARPQRGPGTRSLTRTPSLKTQPSQVLSARLVAGRIATPVLPADLLRAVLVARLLLSPLIADNALVRCRPFCGR